MDASNDDDEEEEEEEEDDDDAVILTDRFAEARTMLCLQSVILSSSRDEEMTSSGRLIGRSALLTRLQEKREGKKQQQVSSKSTQLRPCA